jgi:aldose sugar dehydrogenase
VLRLYNISCGEQRSVNVKNSVSGLLVLQLQKMPLVFFVLLIAVLVFEPYGITTGQSQTEETDNDDESSIQPQIVGDDALAVETVFEGIDITSNMAFLGPDDILVLEKNEGTVKRIVNGVTYPYPLLDVNVVHSDGLLGIAVSKADTHPTYVFLYYTEAPRRYGQDVNDEVEIKSVNSTLGYIRECNCLYRYDLIDNKLQNPKLLLSLPAGPGGQHHGGEIMIGPDNNLYVAIGNIEGHKSPATMTNAQNFKDGNDPDGRAAILRITQDGKPVGEGVLGRESPLNLYFAYGIRNSFGMDFDPVTDYLWDTENGPDHGDEINLVEPGFNSGGELIFGMASDSDEFNPDDLVTFGDRGEYAEPKFVWDIPVGPTALKFFDSSKYGEEYENDMFVGDVNNGYLYHFDLNEDRTELIADTRSDEKVVTTKDRLQELAFGQGFGGITDMQVGPDGYLYVLANGAIFRILPVIDSQEQAEE